VFEVVGPVAGTKELKPRQAEKTKTTHEEHRGGRDPVESDGTGRTPKRKGRNPEKGGFKGDNKG